MSWNKKGGAGGGAPVARCQREVVVFVLLGALQKTHLHTHTHTLRVDADEKLQLFVVG